MFANKGYLSNIICPYYVNGLCERVFCFYKHVLKEDQNAQKKNKEETQQSTSWKYNKETKKVDASLPIYKPTPISELQKMKNHNICVKSQLIKITDNISHTSEKCTDVVVPDNHIDSQQEKKKKSVEKVDYLSDHYPDRDTENIELSTGNKHDIEIQVVFENTDKNNLFNTLPSSFNNTEHSISDILDKSRENENCFIVNANSKSQDDSSKESIVNRRDIHFVNKNFAVNINALSSSVEGDEKLAQEFDDYKFRGNKIHVIKTLKHKCGFGNEQNFDANGSLKNDENVKIFQENFIPVKSGKIRISHVTDQKVASRMLKPVTKKVSPIQAMHQRWVMMRKNMENIADGNEPPGKKLRVSAVPYASSLLLAKKNIDKSVTKEIHNIPNTSKSNNKRIAHIPSNLVLQLPLIEDASDSKIPILIRQRYLKSLGDECLKLYENPDEAFKRALEEEEIFYKRSGSKNAYINLAANAILRLRREVNNVLPIKTNVKNQKMSHEKILMGKEGMKHSWSIESARKKKRAVAASKQLNENGFPSLNALNNDCPVYSAKFNKMGCSSNDRICDRCGATYQVNELGFPLKKEDCQYHPGRAFKKKGQTGWESKYACCLAELQSEGCCIAICHVSSFCNPNQMKEFICIPTKSSSPEVFALDCEMCYTTQGLELTKVSIVDSGCHLIYETLVKPENPILDYNTK